MDKYNDTQFRFAVKNMMLDILRESEFDEYIILLTKIYDDNYFFFSKSLEKLEKAKAKYDNEGVTLWFENSIEVAYHMNIALRMLTTLDDILLKISANLYKYIHKTGPATIKNNSKAADYYYQYIEQSTIAYPVIADKNNRLTRDLRNFITHDGEIIILRDLIEDKNEIGIYYQLSDEGYYERNKKEFESIYENLLHDNDEIVNSRCMLETKILNVLKDKIYKKERPF